MPHFWRKLQLASFSSENQELINVVSFKKAMGWPSTTGRKKNSLFSS